MVILSLFIMSQKHNLQAFFPQGIGTDIITFSRDVVNAHLSRKRASVRCDSMNYFYTRRLVVGRSRLFRIKLRIEQIAILNRRFVIRLHSNTTRLVHA